MGGPLEKDEDEQEAKNGLWAVVKYFLKHPYTLPLVLGSTAALGWMRPAAQAPEEQYWTKAELRQIMREELAPSETGIRKLAELSSLETRIAVLEAMDRARRAKSSVD